MSNFTTENLIPYTGTIQPGQRLIKRKDGTFLPIGVAGAGGGGSTPAASMDFYRCTYVNSSSWGGRKAVLNNGVYSFESNSTTGLVFGAVKPVVGKIYTQDALVRLSYVYTGPIENLIARYSFTEDAADSSGNGNNGTVNGSNLSFSASGVSGFSGQDYISLPFNLANTPFTICLWLSQTDCTYAVWRVLLDAYGSNDFYSIGDGDKLGLTVADQGARSNYGGIPTAPMHVAVTWDPVTKKCQDYKNGVLLGEHTYTGASWSSGSISVGKRYDTYDYYAQNIVMRDLVFVGRVLSAAQITNIMNEI